MVSAEGEGGWGGETERGKRASGGEGKGGVREDEGGRSEGKEEGGWRVRGRE